MQDYEMPCSKIAATAIFLILLKIDLVQPTFLGKEIIEI